MPFDSITGRAAIKKCLSDKKKRAKSRLAQTKQATYMRKLYHGDHTTITNMFKVKKYKHINYCKPTKSNLNPPDQ